MTTDIQTLIEQRPHLKDPLEFYGRWLRFLSRTNELLLNHDPARSREEANTYPQATADSIFQSFVSILELPAEELEQMGQALAVGDIDFMRLPLEGTSADTEGEAAAILFLLSRPYFLALRKASPQNSDQWLDGRCPLCSAQASLSSITEGPKRMLHCSWCGTSGPYRFMGCPNCGTGEASKLSTLVPEEEKGFRIATCDTCQTYVKIVEKGVLDEMGKDLADLASLPLDIVAQKKGFTRRSPNPIGFVTMK